MMVLYLLVSNCLISLYKPAFTAKYVRLPKAVEKGKHRL